MKILNLGCGNDNYGHTRVDVVGTKATTTIFNLNERFLLESYQFDFIYCKSTLEHIKNLGNFSDECYRVLKKGGKIWIRTDYAGHILAYILKAHEPNATLEKQYSAGGFGHNKGDDAHYTLFVESHLRALFNQFQAHKFNYVYGDGFKGFLRRLLPFKLGAYHIEMEAIKS